MHLEIPNLEEVVLGIDPGSTHSGIVVLENGRLVRGDNLSNEDMFTLIDWYGIFHPEIKLLIIYEDIRPYTSRFNMATINTCKVIGRLEYVLNLQRIRHKSITRNEVKNYVFTTHSEMCISEITKKIERKKKTKKDGSSLKPSFQYVDDRIVHKAMRSQWEITSKRGLVNNMGIKDHAWQALGAITACILSEEPSFSVT